MAFFPVLLCDPLNPGGDDCILGPGGPTPEVLASPTIGGITRNHENPWKGGRSCRDPFRFFLRGVFFSHQQIGVHELSMGTLNSRK